MRSCLLLLQVQRVQSTALIQTQLINKEAVGEGKNSPIFKENMITPITNTITGNERAWTYLEVNLPSAISGKGIRRYRIIVVNRDGKLAEYREDMGKATRFKGVSQLNIPSMFEHTVDELRGLADELRSDPGIDIAQLIETNNFKVV